LEIFIARFISRVRCWGP